MVESRVQHGVREIGVAEWFKEGNQVIYQIDTGGDEEALYRLVKPYIGKRYDKLGVLFMAVRTLLRLRLNHNPWGSREDYFCTELLTAHNEYLKARGVPIPKEWEAFYPEDAYEYLARYITNK